MLTILSKAMPGNCLEVGGWLHTFDEGVAQYLGGAVAKVLFQSGVYGAAGANQELALTDYCLQATQFLHQWYAKNRRENPDLSEIGELTSGVLFGPGGLERPGVIHFQQPAKRSHQSIVLFLGDCLAHGLSNAFPIQVCTWLTSPVFNS